MVNTPFSPYDGGYPDESEVFLEYESPIMAKLSKADQLFELLPESDEDIDTESLPRSYSTDVFESPAQVEQSPAREKTPSVQARFLSDLVERIVAEGKLLLTEDGRAFAYQEEGGCYKPVTNLEAYLASTLTTETDATAAFVNRIRVLLFNNSIPPEKQDKRLADELWNERDSIVALALQAAQRLMQRNFEFTQPEDSRKFLNSFTLRGNVLGGFLAECCDLDPAARAFNTDLYSAYAAYCKRNGLEAVSRQVLYDLLSGVPGVYAKRVRIGAENRQGHMGIALKRGTPNCGTLEPRT